MVFQVDLVADDGNPGKGTLLLAGYVRARCLSVNQLVNYSSLAQVIFIL